LLKRGFKRGVFITEEGLHFGLERFCQHKSFYVTPSVG
jgi:hypothetical protein